MSKTYLIGFIVVAVVGLIVGFEWGVGRGPAVVPPPADSGASSVSAMQITSPVFADNGAIPEKYTCDVSAPPSPPLAFAHIPAGAKSLALIVDDPDVPQAALPSRMFVHWVLFNIDPAVTGIPEGGSVGVKGANGAKALTFAGPCPPPQFAPAEHRYFFTLYALDAMLPLKEGATKQNVLDAVQGHVLAVTQLIGRYARVATGATK